jgi:hypothetical protein
VLVTERAIFVIEFKTLNGKFDPAARIQAEDYALDLRDFHAGSRNEIIVPIVVAKSGEPTPTQWAFPLPGVSSIYETFPNNLAELLNDLHRKFVSYIRKGNIKIAAWEKAPYRPLSKARRCRHQICARRYRQPNAHDKRHSRRNL